MSGRLPQARIIAVEILRGPDHIAMRPAVSLFTACYGARMQAQFPAEQAKSGEFKRQEDAFRDWVKRDGSSAYQPERDRYHLYVSLACPWAHRTIILRRLKGLEEVIGMTVVDPVRDERGWAFTDAPDPVNGFKFLSEAYRASDPGYDERVTVPVLWDTQTKRIV